MVCYPSNPEVTVALTDNVDVKMEPFQIIFLTAENEGAAVNDIDNSDTFNKMTLLQVTRQHLVNNEFKNHENFLSLALFQTIRSDEELFANGTQVAFTGTVTYFDEPTTTMTQESMQEIEYMCFLGETGNAYVDSLRAMGWRNLDRAVLLTVGGDMVEYIDGTMVMVDMSSEDAANVPVEMDDETSKMIYSVAVLVPTGVVLLAILVCVLCLARWNVTWTNPSDPNGLAWQADPSKAKKLRRFTLEIKNGDDTSQSIAESEITDVPSVKAAIAAPRRSPRPVPQSSVPRRQRDSLWAPDSI